jgi:hypothetical protein
MLAGALVSSIHRHSGCRTDLSSYNFGQITSLKAGISEHAIMFPVDSIKVCHPIYVKIGPQSKPSFLIAHLVLPTLYQTDIYVFLPSNTRESEQHENRPECNSSLHHPQPYTLECHTPSRASPLQKVCEHYGVASPLLSPVLDQPTPSNLERWRR